MPDLSHTYTAVPNPFLFSSSEVRTAVDEQGEAWFCAKDVCDILEHSNPSMAIENLDDDERDTLSNTDGVGRKKDMLFISESGLYALIFASRKPAAKQFRKWVTSEVLPSIRKQGFYGQVPVQLRLGYSQQIVKLSEKLVSNKDRMVHEILLNEIRDICNLVGRRLPDVTLLDTPRTGTEG